MINGCNAATKAGLRTFAASVRHEVAGERIGVTSATRCGSHPVLRASRIGLRPPLSPPAAPAKAATALLRAVERGDPEVFVPRWLAVAARVQGAAPELFHRLAKQSDTLAAQLPAKPQQRHHRGDPHQGNDPAVVTIRKRCLAAWRS